jgi:putative transposase
MPRRAPVDPQGYYHVGSRGSYGQALFRNDFEHELFLRLYARTAVKYEWKTLSWALVWNHHHFAIRLTKGGLSEGMRELNGGFSRRIHAKYGMTTQGHLVRHAFFARRLQSEGEILVACRYVDLNVPLATGRDPEDTRWGGYRATVGFEYPREFHEPGDLLDLVSRSPNAAQRAYRRFVHEGLALQRYDPSPNERFDARG